MNNLIGEVYSKNLLVIERTTERFPGSGEVMWLCECQCGQTVKYSTSQLTHQGRATCGCRLRAKLTNGMKHPFGPERVRQLKAKRGKVSIEDLSPTKVYRMVRDYIKGISTVDLSDKYKIHPKSLQRHIKKFRDQLNQQYELNQMVNMNKFKQDGQHSKLTNVLQRRFTEEELKSVTSPDDSATLTNEEALYALLYVRTGSNQVALKDSGFVDCLKIKDQVRKQLLGIYLREKPNVASYIRELQEKQLDALDIKKDSVQCEIVNQIQQLKEVCAVDGSPAQRGHLIRAIELLGKTIGAFQENIRIEEVDPSKALDHLIELAKVESTYSIEDLESDE